MTSLNKDKYQETASLIVLEWLTTCFVSSNVNIRGYYERIDNALEKPRVSVLLHETAQQSTGAGRNNTNSYFRWMIAPIEIMVNKDSSGQNQLNLIRLSDTLMKYAKSITTGTPYLGSLGLHRAELTGANTGHTDKFLRHIHYLKFRIEV